MKEVFHKNFHILERVEPGEGKRKRKFIMATWRPKQDIWLIGTAIGLLCCKSDNYEIYLAVSKNPSLEPRKFLVGHVAGGAGFFRSTYNGSIDWVSPTTPPPMPTTTINSIYFENVR